MVKRKNQMETLESLLARPWCYYCNKDFDDVKILVTHQKQKHFQCTVPSCHRRLNTAGGLRVHLQQVHKEDLLEVPNAEEGRRDPNLEIFAMEGVPADLVEARVAIVSREYKKLEQEFYQKTGNPLPGTGGHLPSKKPKTESKEEMMARLAAHKAKKAAEKAAAAAGVSVAPTGINSTADIANTFPQHTPTPPTAASYGAAPLSSIPSYPLVPPPSASSPVPPNVAQWSQPANGAWQLDQGRSGSAYGFPPGMNSASPPPGAPHLAQISPALPQPPAFFSPVQTGPPISTLPPVPHPNALPRYPPGSLSVAQQSPDGSNRTPTQLPLPPGLPVRPTPPGQLPLPPSVPPKPMTTPVNEELEALMDSAQNSVARANAKKVKLDAGLDSHVSVNHSATPESREIPRKEAKNPQDHKQATARTSQLLQNNTDSFEEIKASSRYHVKPQSTIIPTSEPTQSAAGPVDDGAHDVVTS